MSQKRQISLRIFSGFSTSASNDTSMKDFSVWKDVSKLPLIDKVCEKLARILPKNPSIILNHIEQSRKDEIMNAFTRYFSNIKWQHIEPDEKARGLDPTKPLKQYLSFYFPRFLLRLLMIHKRADLIISPVCNPYLYNISSAKYTMLIDDDLRAYMAKNRLFKEIIKFFALLFRSFKAAYLDLYIAKKKSDVFNEVARGSFPLKRMSPEGLIDGKVKIA